MVESVIMRYVAQPSQVQVVVSGWTPLAVIGTACGEWRQKLQPPRSSLTLHYAAL
jgi:hypothetical protein